MSYATWHEGHLLTELANEADDHSRWKENELFSVYVMVLGWVELKVWFYSLLHQVLVCNLVIKFYLPTLSIQQRIAPAELLHLLVLFTTYCWLQIPVYRLACPYSLSQRPTLSIMTESSVQSGNLAIVLWYLLFRGKVNWCSMQTMQPFCQRFHWCLQWERFEEMAPRRVGGQWAGWIWLVGGSREETDGTRKAGETVNCSCIICVFCIMSKNMNV